MFRWFPAGTENLVAHPIVLTGEFNCSSTSLSVICGVDSRDNDFRRSIEQGSRGRVLRNGDWIESVELLESTSRIRNHCMRVAKDGLQDRAEQGRAQGRNHVVGQRARIEANPVYIA
jgi:hypothetical protein